MPRHRSVSDAQIVRAARRVFLEHGTQAPVSAVARELGVSTATIFVRMGTKSRLITAALWPPDPPILEVLQTTAPDDRPLHEQLVPVAVEIARFVEAEIPATFTLYAAGLRPKSTDDFSDATPRRLRRALNRWLQAAKEVRLGGLDARMVTEALIGTLEARTMHAFLSKTPSKERETLAFVGSLVSTVLGPPTRPSA